MNDKYVLERIKWPSLETISNAFFESNKYLTPYSDYYFLTRILKHPNLHYRKAFNHCSFDTLLLKKDGVPVYIAPLFVNKRKKCLYLAGHFNSVGHTDFLYPEAVSFDDFVSLVECLSKHYPTYNLCLDRISQFSKTYFFMNQLGAQPIKKEICLKIDFDSYESWFSSLSKGHRQNIRTGYNRLARENKKISFVYYLNEMPSKRFYKDHMALFSKRILEHSNLSNAFFLPMLFLKKNESLSKALLCYKKKIFSGIYIESKLAGSLNGVISEDGRAIITRLSINRSFGVYTPGGLLLNETIKAITSNNDKNILSLDLSRGGEKYKYYYGGKEHYNYSYILPLSDSNR